MRDKITISSEIVGRQSRDEGVVRNPAAVLNKVCASDLDLDELISADFIASLGESGVFIRHWAQHVGIDD